MKKKMRLKKKVKRLLIIIIILIIVSVSGYFIYNKLHNEYLYHQTYEYKLLEKGYDNDEINLLLKYFDDDYLNSLLEKENKDTNLIKLISNDKYINDNLERYQNYIKNNINLDYDTVIKNVNLNLDYNYYEVNFGADTSLNYLMLVNKYYLLDKDYKPDDLTLISTNYSWGNDNYIRKDVYEAFINMRNAAKESGYTLMINSAYRSYESQEKVYENKQKIGGTKYADSIAARPGASEHQTGLALDIFELNNSSSKTFKDTEVFTWLKENCYKYGFILRFTEETEKITGYSAESWHYRYVGIETATKIHELGITLEEYYVYYINKK